MGWRKESNTDTQLMAWSWDAGGGLRWTAEWGGEGIEKARAIEYDPLSDSVLIAGSTTSGESEDIALLRLSASDGALLEEQVWGGAGNEVAKVLTLTTTLANVMTGSFDGVFTYRVDADGKILNLRGFWELDQLFESFNSRG